MTFAIFSGRFLAARFSLVAGCALVLAACQTDGSGPAAVVEGPGIQASRPPEPARSEPITHTRAARECWMRTEKSGSRENLDKRADIVNKCIDEKMKAAGTS